MHGRQEMEGEEKAERWVLWRVTLKVNVAGWKEDKESKESKRRKELHCVLRVQEKQMTGCLEKRIIIA